MGRDFEQTLKELGGYITMQYDYPPNGEGSIGYKGHNMYRFRIEDMDKINAFLNENAEVYKAEKNISSLAQEILSDLLDEGLIEYGRGRIVLRDRERLEKLSEH